MNKATGEDEGADGPHGKGKDDHAHASRRLFEGGRGLGRVGEGSDGVVGRGAGTSNGQADGLGVTDRNGLSIDTQAGNWQQTVGKASDSTSGRWTGRSRGSPDGAPRRGLSSSSQLQPPHAQPQEDCRSSRSSSRVSYVSSVAPYDTSAAAVHSAVDCTVGSSFDRDGDCYTTEDCITSIEDCTSVSASPRVGTGVGARREKQSGYSSRTSSEDRHCIDPVVGTFNQSDLEGGRVRDGDRRLPGRRRAASNPVKYESKVTEDGYREGKDDGTSYAVTPEMARRGGMRVYGSGNRLIYGNHHNNSICETENFEDDELVVDSDRKYNRSTHRETPPGPEERGNGAEGDSYMEGLGGLDRQCRRHGDIPWEGDEEGDGEDMDVKETSTLLGKTADLYLRKGKICRFVIRCYF